MVNAYGKGRKLGVCSLHHGSSARQRIKQVLWVEDACTGLWLAVGFDAQDLGTIKGSMCISHQVLEKFPLVLKIVIERVLKWTMRVILKGYTWHAVQVKISYRMRAEIVWNAGKNNSVHYTFLFRMTRKSAGRGLRRALKMIWSQFCKWRRNVALQEQIWRF